MFKEFTTSVPAATPFAQWIKHIYLNKLTLFNESDTQQSSTDKPVALEFPIELEFRNVGFEEGGKLENPEKNPRNKGENQQWTQSTYDARSGNRTRDTCTE